MQKGLIIKIIPLILVFSVFWTKISFSQYKNLAYQLYLYDKIYSALPQDTLTVSDLIAISENEQKRQEYIVYLKNEIIIADARVKQLQVSVNQMKIDLQRSKENYARLLYFIFLSRKILKNNFVFVFSAQSFNQAFFRYNFLRLLLSYLHSLSVSIKQLKNSLFEKQQILRQQIKIKRELLKKLSENEKLHEEFLSKQLTMIKNLEQKDENLRLKIENLRKSQTEIKQMIENFSKNFVADTSSQMTENFLSYKGKLSLPLHNSFVVSSFGVHKHPSLRNITVRNDGIDLMSKTDTLVYSVFEGRVIKVLTLPTGAKAIIIRHGDFYTVFANLSNVYVVENQQVFSQQIIGSISKKYSDYSYPVLNFQIWRKTEKQDPQLWLNFN